MSETYKISDKDFGEITIRSSSRARRVSFRAENGAITIVWPTHWAIDNAYILKLIDSNREALHRLLKRSSKTHVDTTLYDGKVIKIEEGELRLCADNTIGRGRVVVRHFDGGLYFLFNAEDISSASFQRGFSRFILHTITRLYASTLRDLVDTCAQRCKPKVREVRIGRGRRVLGSCTRSGIITISAFVLFLPQHLRHYIVYHELAHLYHHDHSTHFHKVCDMLCDGREKEWNKELKQFAFPIDL